MGAPGSPLSASRRDKRLWHAASVSLAGVLRLKASCCCTTAASRQRRPDMNWPKRFWFRLICACVAATAVAAVESALFDWETIGGSLLVTCFVIPSVLLFFLIEARWEARNVRNAAFLSSLLPASTYCLVGIVTAFGSSDGEVVSELCRTLLFAYLTQAAAAWGVLAIRCPIVGPSQS